MSEKLSRREFILAPLAGFFGGEDVQDHRIDELEDKLNLLTDVLNHNTIVFDNRLNKIEDIVIGMPKLPDKTQV